MKSDVSNCIRHFLAFMKGNFCRTHVRVYLSPEGVYISVDQAMIDLRAKVSMSMT